jgi:Ca2+-binding RTX toxin-like protein
MGRIRGIAAGLTLLAVVLGAGSPAGSAAAAGADSASCAVHNAKLVVNAHENDMTLLREDEQVAVIGPGSVPCVGGTRRLNRLDSILVIGGDVTTVDLRGGPLAPGRTTETDGTNEIEVLVTKASYPEVITGPEPQRLDVGSDSRGGARIDFDPEPGAPERDVGYGPDRDIELTIRTGPGDDVLEAHDVPVFLALVARGGDDRVLGPDIELPRFASWYLSGGPGDDFVEGGPGSDVIDGGRGDDVLRSHSGRDLVAPRGGQDDADCGPGNDFFYLASEKRDEVRSCERRWLPN